MGETVRNGWEACPPGEFTRLAARLRARHRRRDAVRGTLSLAVALLIGSVLYQSWSRSREYHFAGISCSRVMALAPDYAMGKLQPALHDQVHQHVSRCPHCKPLFQKMGIVVQERHPTRATISRQVRST
ncbi:MAG: zf-HC2 domain-containing protein [Isosphaeraceae bacterium]